MICAFSVLRTRVFVVHEEPSDESTERSYNAWVDFRECMIDQGNCFRRVGQL